MGRPGSTETIDTFSDLVPVVGHRLTGRDLEVLPKAIVGIAGHSVCFLWIVVGLIRSVTLE